METSLYITQAHINVQKSDVLYNRPFTPQSLAEDFEAATGHWQVDAEGWLTGMHRENSGGMLYSKASFPGDILMTFTARTVAPCANDLNFVFKTRGWDAATADAGPGYIAGLGGWWENKAGIEHYPSCLPRALTAAFRLEAGREHQIATGCVGRLSFIIVDGALVVELFDPFANELAEYGRFGFGAYASHVQYRGLCVYRPAAVRRDMEYAHHEW